MKIFGNRDLKFSWKFSIFIIKFISQLINHKNLIINNFENLIMEVLTTDGIYVLNAL